MSSIESAPATIPATSAATFAPACAPRSAGTVSCSSANRRRPARSASASTGTSPADRHEIRLIERADGQRDDV